ncbi:sushi domain protein [Ancylostoma caninum]|uniref:Sushi domain protein n=1 Tax=Ancylostoma caninum TaxID=29170 RepID=A0A368GX56_ANCCA|nr:sushi domain protein [Ancylostoma caninum]
MFPHENCQKRANSSICTNNGWYPAEFGICRAKTSGGCLEFPPVPGGDVLYYNYDGYSTATLRCQNGSVHVRLRTSGTVTSFCSNGMWNPPSLGTCNVTNSEFPFLGSICPLFAVPEGAMITYSTNITNITLWTTAMMKCLSGDAVLGMSHSTCLSTGWHPSQLGTCPNTTTGRECERLPQRVGAEIVYAPPLWRDNVTEGTNATLKCRDGEHVVGASFTRCMNKTWNPSELGMCSPATGLSCFSMNTPAGGHLEYSNGATGFIPHGGNVTLTCLTGRVVNGGDFYLLQLEQPSDPCFPHFQEQECQLAYPECGIPLQWANVPTPLLLTLVTKLCHPLNAPVNGTVSLSKGLPDFPAETGVVAMLVCKPGSYVLGSTSSLCTDGTWIPSSLGTCSSNASSGGRCSSTLCTSKDVFLRRFVLGCLKTLQWLQKVLVSLPSRMN